MNRDGKTIKCSVQPLESLPNKIFEEKFFIDFENVWQFGRYSTKGHAENLVKQKLKENEDYILLTNIRKQNDGKTAFDRRGGHNAKNYILSSNGFLNFLARSQKSIAKYFQ